MQIKLVDKIYDNVTKEIEALSLEELRAVAIDTINWQTGISIKKDLDNNQVLLSASNSKAIVLLAKALGLKNTDISTLTTKEQTALNKIVELGGTDYTDSDMLIGSLLSTDAHIKAGAEKIVTLTNAQTKEEIVEVLNG